MSRFNRVWLYSDSWHVTVHSDVKHTAYSVAVLSMGVHDESVHDVGMHSMGVQRMGVATKGVTKQCSSSAKRFIFISQLLIIYCNCFRLYSTAVIIQLTTVALTWRISSATCWRISCCPPASTICPFFYLLYIVESFCAD
jgi:hypothetical protein